MAAQNNKMAVIGGGSWGTALAELAARAGHAVRLYARDPAIVAQINDDHENLAYLPQTRLHDQVTATAEMAALGDAEAVLLVVPAQQVRSVARDLQAAVPEPVPVVICAKGIEHGSGLLMSEVAAQELPNWPLAVLSGPSFAAEAVRGQPTAVTLAANDIALAQHLSTALASAYFRPYSSDDIVGVEVCGAVKNVIAIAAGIAGGMGFGANTEAALITRGLAEIGRLTRALGGRPETTIGLAGLGDLMLTCGSRQSRNTDLGYRIGSGEAVPQALACGPLAEGVYSAAAVLVRAANAGVEMPIAAAVDAVINKNADLTATVDGLLARPLRGEHDR